MRLVIYSVVIGMLAGGAVVSTKTLAKQTETKSESREKDQKRTPQEYEEEMEDFVPSEKVPADSAISFPVDI